MVVKHKTKLTSIVVSSNPCKYFILCSIQEKRDRDRTEHFVNFINRAFERNLGFRLIYFYFAVSVRFFSPQQHHFPNLIKSLS